MLLMKKAFFEAVRSGRKTVTVRYWRYQRVRPAEVHTVPGFGKIRIEQVRTVSLSALGEEDAVADGFASAAQMRKALTGLYPDLARLAARRPARGSSQGRHGSADSGDGRRLFAVHFTYFGE